MTNRLPHLTRQAGVVTQRCGDRRSTPKRRKRSSGPPANNASWTADHNHRRCFAIHQPATKISTKSWQIPSFLARICIVKAVNC